MSDNLKSVESQVLEIVLYNDIDYHETDYANGKRGQEPVAAQVRFRRPEKGLADWSVWQQTTIKPNMPTWSIDSAGYEVEYRLLYTSPQPSAVPVEASKGGCDCSGLCKQRGLASDEVDTDCKAVYGAQQPSEEQAEITSEK